MKILIIEAGVKHFKTTSPQITTLRYEGGVAASRLITLRSVISVLVQGDLATLAIEILTRQAAKYVL